LRHAYAVYPHGRIGRRCRCRPATPLTQPRPTDVPFTKQLGKHLDPTKLEQHDGIYVLDFPARHHARPQLRGLAPERHGNINGKRDLALHLGDAAASLVAFITEVQEPKSPDEMRAPTDFYVEQAMKKEG
jgi:hypothetical protein